LFHYIAGSTQGQVHSALKNAAGRAFGPKPCQTGRRFVFIRTADQRPPAPSEHLLVGNPAGMPPPREWNRTFHARPEGPPGVFRLRLFSWFVIRNSWLGKEKSKDINHEFHEFSLNPVLIRANSCNSWF